MPNTNFQTFHQMGQAINEVVRQATGRDAVQNIDMDHVTVAQNHYYEEVTLSAGRISFTDSVGGMPLEKCVVQIKPVQDLHGYSKPWTGGAGKNLYPVLIGNDSFIPNNNGAFTNDSGELVISTPISGASNTGAYLSPVGSSNPSAFSNVVSALESAFVISFDAMSADGVQLRYGFSSDITHFMRLTNSWQRISLPIEAGSADSIRPFCFYISNSVANTSMRIKNVQIELGTTATAYEPYSNICPITGWTGVNIHVSPTTNAQDGTTYTVSFQSEAGTVYGGTLDVTTGRLTVDRAVDVLDGTQEFLGNGTLPYGGIQIAYTPAFDKKTGSSSANQNIGLLSDKFDTSNPNPRYAFGMSGRVVNGNIYMNMPESVTTTSVAKTWFASNNTQVSYILADPITYQLTPQEIRTLLGTNNIWADTGDIEVKVKLLKELY